MGRPTLCTPERTERIRQALIAGAPIGVAASRGPIAEGTFHEWHARGRAALETHNHDRTIIPADHKERPFAEFAEATTRARHEWELGRLAHIAQAGHGHPYKVTVTKDVLRKDGTVVTLTETREGVEPGDWRADAWLLERRKPHEYGRLTRTWLSGPDDQPIEVAADELTARGEEAIDEVARKRDQRQAV